MARRLQGMGVEKYKNGFSVTLHPDVLAQPLEWKRPRMVFVNSMSDLFHEQVPLEYVQRIFEVIRRCPQHVFQALTKRSKRLVRAADKLAWPPNLWMGVTVESATYRFRIDDLRKTPAALKWISFEPLLGSIGDVDLSGIAWAVVGGESGPGARVMREEWALELLRQCRAEGTAFFFKQWGGMYKNRAGRLLRGELYEEMPALPGESGELALAFVAGQQATSTRAGVADTEAGE